MMEPLVQFHGLLLSQGEAQHRHQIPAPVALLVKGKSLASWCLGPLLCKLETKVETASEVSRELNE